MRGGGGGTNIATPQKKLTITARKVDKTPSPSHTVRIEITATPQIEILYTASKKHQNRNTANPHVPFSPLAATNHIFSGFFLMTV